MKMTAAEMLNKFSKNTSHPQEVQRLAAIIFEETNKKIFEMSEKEKEYLETAALLHDIGYFKEAKGHNKHSMHIIIENGLEGFTQQETKIIGCICRYHRGGLPDKIEHDVYNTLEKPERKVVKRLGGILKLADGLDKDHKRLIDDIKIEYDFKNQIAQFKLYTTLQKPDIRTAIRKRDLFETGFKCQSVIIFND